MSRHGVVLLLLFLVADFGPVQGASVGLKPSTQGLDARAARKSRHREQRHLEESHRAPVVEDDGKTDGKTKAVEPSLKLGLMADSSKKVASEKANMGANGNSYSSSDFWIIPVFALVIALSILGLHITAKGQGGFNRTFGIGRSKETTAFREDEEIALAAYMGLMCMVLLRLFIDVLCTWKNRHLYHSNARSTIGLRDALDMLVPMFRQNNLKSFLRKERDNYFPMSYVMNKQYLTTSVDVDAEKVHHDKLMERLGDRPMFEEEWLDAELEGHIKDQLRLLVRFFYVSERAKKYLKGERGLSIPELLTLTVSKDKRDGRGVGTDWPVDDEAELLDMVYMYRLRAFRLNRVEDLQARSHLRKLKQEAPVVGFFQKDGTFKAEEISKDCNSTVCMDPDDYIAQEISDQELKLAKMEEQLQEKLAGCWANLRFIVHEMIDEKVWVDDMLSTVDNWMTFVLVFVGLNPQMRAYTAADPHCPELMEMKDGKAVVKQGLPRHGPKTDMPLPTIGNVMRWECGNEATGLIASDVTCILICHDGYTPMLGNSYCRNIGGAGTEFTHLMTVDGLPINKRSMLDSANCCVATKDAATLTNFRASASNNDYTLTWENPDVFAHVCGSEQKVEIQFCSVATSAANSPSGRKRLCDDACSNPGSVEDTLAKCTKSASITVGDPGWPTMDITNDQEYAKDKLTDSFFRSASARASFSVNQTGSFGSVTPTFVPNDERWIRLAMTGLVTASEPVIGGWVQGT